jgi:hypothetical protein
MPSTQKEYNPTINNEMGDDVPEYKNGLLVRHRVNR